MKTKVVQHVPRIKLDSLTNLTLLSIDMETKVVQRSASPKDQTCQLDNLVRLGQVLFFIFINNHDIG